MTAPGPSPDRIPPNWGGSLNASDYSALSDSWITREIADAAMLRRVDARTGRQVVGQKGSRDCAGLLIPYYWPGDPSPFEYRIRRDDPDLVQGIDGKIKQERKYLSPPSGANRLYFPPGVTLEQLADASIPIVITEGEKKALALRRLANFETDKPRFVPIAISGVWNWKGKIGKTGGPNGERLDVHGPIADLARIAWKGRAVQIVFDRNVHTNDSVKCARKGIARDLATRGAEVAFVNLPEDCGVNGVDDLLALWGPAKVLELFEQSVSAAGLTVVLPPQFQSTPQGMFRTFFKDGSLMQVQISNYQARIIANVLVDDGVEVKRELEIESELLERKSQFCISADDFAGMEWVIKQLGGSAITFPSQKEYARTAIQWNSLTAEERRIYSHSGWREVGGSQLFLHGGGAIGGSGDVTGINVRFGGTLGGYQLRLPISDEALAKAVRASLRLLDLAPPTVSFPLFAATFRAVFGNADFAMHLTGETGAFKSALAALYQQHFGAGMDRLHLPGNWSSTGNALEMMAFQAKDTLFVIDDFAPQGSAVDVARYHAAAERVLRAAGNRAGRNRLNSAALLREQKPPRALILSTGEDIPKGHSIRARMLILELPKDAISLAELTKCQSDASDGLYAEAMGGFIQRIASQHPKISEYFDTTLSEYRKLASAGATHARTPDIITNLQAAFELFLEFCVECGAIDAAERQHLSTRCWGALRQAAESQSKHQAAAEPTSLFLSALRSVLVSGKAHLANRYGSTPDDAPESCGWRHDGDKWMPLGERIGWVDGEDIFLEPAVAYRVAQTTTTAMGNTIPVTLQTLNKRLHEKGLLASTESTRETLTVRKRMEGSSKAVLHFLRALLLPDDPDQEDENVR